MRILITNDDAVFAPGIAALARGLAGALGDDADLVVVAPLVDHSGAGAAVGRVYDRESIPYETVEIPGLEHVPTFGIDGPPALAVILACIEGFGERPDLVVSGVNHGINAGRSALHSGTVGAVLTAAQFGLRGLAVSLAWGTEPIPWETPVSLACAMVPSLAATEPATVLNLNVPAVPLHELHGVRHGTLGRVGLIRAARQERVAVTTAASVPGSSAEGTGDGTGGAVTLTLRGGRGSDPTEEQREVDPATDAGAVAEGWASVTSLTGVREDVGEAGTRAVAAAIQSVSR